MKSLIPENNPFRATQTYKGQGEDERSGGAGVRLSREISLYIQCGQAISAFLPTHLPTQARDHYTPANPVGRDQTQGGSSNLGWPTILFRPRGHLRIGTLCSGRSGLGTLQFRPFCLGPFCSGRLCPGTFCFWAIRLGPLCSGRLWLGIPSFGPLSCAALFW